MSKRSRDRRYSSRRRSVKKHRSIKKYSKSPPELFVSAFRDKSARWKAEAIKPLLEEQYIKYDQMLRDKDRLRDMGKVYKVGQRYAMKSLLHPEPRYDDEYSDIRELQKLTRHHSWPDRTLSEYGIIANPASGATGWVSFSGVEGYYNDDRFNVDDKLNVYKASGSSVVAKLVPL